ncbi:recombinase RecT [Aquamicrobium sp.]|uniref:recombinase RecT n=1 Tax=Aquamicrobium sp. TaxID=1872579 RepID=UPI002590C3A7|nr:recombinase RecT [Aquamicrobium sp.]MCK9549488.1 recombinase RecT [Aquamicrobium sp.]
MNNDKEKGRLTTAKELISKTKLNKYSQVYIEMAMNNNLKNCSMDSILFQITRIVDIGLNPNPLFGEAFVVPYNVKDKVTKQVIDTVATLQIGYKGLQMIGYRAGWIFESYPVYTCDKYSSKLNGISMDHNLEPDFNKRDEENPTWVFNNLVGIICYGKDSRGNIFSKYINKAKLEKIRLKNPNAQDKLTGIWREWTIEMYQKIAIKYSIKRWPIESDKVDIRSVIAMDEELDLLEDAPVKTKLIEAEPNQPSAKSTTKTSGTAINSTLKSLKLNVYAIDDIVVADGNTFGKTKVLGDLGFSIIDGEWCYKTENDHELLEIIYGQNYLSKDGYMGVKNPDNTELLSAMGFKYSQGKDIWFKKAADEQSPKAS